ncbi:hypothetical protein C9374_001050 [Naegleria lovaniensis]|uniref:Uncharacterized protein n=1 Tax=Naegleria lovaniensis TaxID=51637 RepID=A0AA88GWD2_NAELO|nr:uncharacterized protein C9374_001050 [Naegleria lovaniensis]KAG2388200.1 hypothetical protein C9374_001050 [Naegleria lovaniensis]
MNLELDEHAPTAKSQHQISYPTSANYPSSSFNEDDRHDDDKSTLNHSDRSSIQPYRSSNDDHHHDEGHSNNNEIDSDQNNNNNNPPTTPMNPITMIKKFFSSLNSSQLKWLFGLGMKQWPLLLIGTISMLISTGLSLVLPLFLTQLVDVIPSTMNSNLPSGETNHEEGQAYLNRAALYLLAIVCGIGLTTAIKHFCFNFAGERVVAKLRKDLFENIIVQDVSFFDVTKTGELLNRLSSDTKSLENAVTSNLFIFLRNTVQAIGGVGFLFYTSWKLTLVTLSIVPPLIIGAIIYAKIVKKLSRKVQDALAKSAEVAEESFSNLRTVRSFSKESFHVSEYNVSIDNTLTLARKLAISGGVFSGIMMFCSSSAVILVLWYGGSLVLSKEITIGLLTSFIVYTFYVASSLGVVSSIFFDLMKAMGATARIHELLLQKPTIEKQRVVHENDKKDEHSQQEGDFDDSPFHEIEGHIQFHNVKFSYPSRPTQSVLKGLEIELVPSTVTALVGKSGQGKTTVASLLQRFYDPNDGQITLDGMSIRELDTNFLRKHIGVVQQEPTLFSNSIRENICYGWESGMSNSNRTEPTLEEIQDAAIKANAHEFIMGFPEGYDTLVGERGLKLSGGQKQRIAIARAILKNPKILILDEATASLDSNTEFLVQEALQRLMEGRTVLVIAHRLSTIRNAHRVYVINDGRVAEQGNHEELMQLGGIYKRLVEKQLISGEIQQ